jgi:hypothetical protein
MEWKLLTAEPEQFKHELLERFELTAEKCDLTIDPIPSDVTNCATAVLDKVLHRINDIPRYLEKVKETIRTDGFVLVVEVTSNFDLAFFIESMTITEDQLPAAGDSARIHGMYMKHDQWLTLFDQCGFDVCAYQTDDASFMTTLYMLRVRPKVPLDPAFVDVSDVREFTWIAPLQKVIEERLGTPNENTIWVCDTKTRDNGLCGLALCLREEQGKFNRIRTLFDISLKADRKAVDMNDEATKKIISYNLHANAYRDGEWGSIVHLVVKEGMS